MYRTYRGLLHTVIDCNVATDSSLCLRGDDTQLLCSLQESCNEFRPNLLVYHHVPCWNSSFGGILNFRTYPSIENIREPPSWTCWAHWPPQHLTCWHPPVPPGVDNIVSLVLPFNWTFHPLVNAYEQLHVQMVPKTGGDTAKWYCTSRYFHRKWYLIRCVYIDHF